jgi:hypothetical protein
MLICKICVEFVVRGNDLVNLHWTQLVSQNCALAKNALVLVSEYGCPHVFLTLTCNPEWPEIQSQLINGQTVFDPPDVTIPVFQSRLDKSRKISGMEIISNHVKLSI